MPHWLEFYSYAIYNDVTNDKKGFINTIVKGLLYIQN